MRFKADNFITALFKAYLENPGLLPLDTRRKAQAHGIRRAVCDEISSMTDRSMLDEYRRLFDPYRKV
jgi:dGTPase